jgi:hypothetical protein
MLCDDGVEYFVKFPEHGSRALINEALGSAIASALSLPAPDAALVELKPELIDASNQLKERKAQPGLYFGSATVPNAFDFSENEAAAVTPSDIRNRTDASTIVGYDNWVRNMDRRNHGNLILKSESQSDGPRYRLYLVDNGLILTGAQWTRDTLSKDLDTLTPVPSWPFLDSCLYDRAEFESVMKAVESMDPVKLKELREIVPASWKLADDEAEAVDQFLLRRKGLLRSILSTYPLNPNPPKPTTGA